MFSENLRLLRQSKQLNQVQLAQRLDVKKQTISNWESGNIMPSIQMLEKIADYFNVTTDYLLSRKVVDEKYKTIDATGLSCDQYDLINRIVEEFKNVKK